MKSRDWDGRARALVRLMRTSSPSPGDLQKLRLLALLVQKGQLVRKLAAKHLKPGQP